MAQLAGEPAAGEKEPQGDTDVLDDEHVAVQFGENDGQCEKYSVSRLIRGEAMVVRERDGVCKRSTELIRTVTKIHRHLSGLNPDPKPDDEVGTTNLASQYRTSE